MRDYWRNLSTNSRNKAQLGTNVLSNMIHTLQDYTGDLNGIKDVVIDYSTVSSAIKRLKNGKACGVDNIPNEFLKNGGHALILSLTKLFKFCKLTECFPEQWHQGLVKPLHKDGSKESLNNYRGITVCSNVYKVFTSVIERQLMGYLEEYEVLGEMHGAYRKGRRLEDQYFTLKGICCLRKSKKLKTWLSFLDISKAFDTVDRDRLFIKLWEKGIQGKAWRLIKGLYSKVENRVIFGPFESTWFEVSHGVKQGCIMSPTLFSLVMSDLVDMLESQGLGIPHRDIRIPCLLYADDIALLSDSEDNLTRMLNVAYAFCLKWGMKVNENKSKVMVIGKRCNSCKKWMLGNVAITECTVYKYLGIMFSQSLSDSAHVKTYLKPKAIRLRSYLNSILSAHENVNRVTFGDSIWKNVILPSITHGCSVWLNDSMESKSTLKSIQYSMAKAIMQVKSSPAVTAVLGELGWLPLELSLDKFRLKYYHRMRYDVPDTRLCKQIFDDMANGYLDNSPYHWPYFPQVNKILINAGIGRAMFSTNSEWLQPFLKRQLGSYKIDFFQDIDEKTSLQWYRAFKDSTFGVKYLFDTGNFYGTRLKFLARVGCLGINENVCRWGKSDSKCDLCGLHNETLLHFLFTCSKINFIRVKYYVKLENRLKEIQREFVWWKFISSSLLTKLCMFLGTQTKSYRRETAELFDRICKQFL